MNDTELYSINAISPIEGDEAVSLTKEQIQHVLLVVLIYFRELHKYYMVKIQKDTEDGKCFQQGGISDYL